jgi:arginine/lysine/ornithine decarboxylase
MPEIDAPLYARLVRRWERGPVSFHVPGHQYGRALTEDPFALFRDIMKLDVTELEDTDDLHDPEGVIREAQCLAARCFGADETFFLVGGSTAGNLAMLLAVLDPGDAIIVQRNVHKSVLNGIALARARAIFVAPQFEPASGLPTVPRAADIETALKRYPEAKAVFLSTPNYYGMHVRLAPYAEIAHRHQVPLLVDEAHGAHFGLHPACPPSAIRSGADAAVQSTHKTLTALTMGAMLHVRRGRVSLERLRRALSAVQSSSPSYPILASLDIARAIIEARGPAWLEGGMKAATRLRDRLASRNAPFEIVKPITGEACGAVDPMRVVLRDATGTIGGFRLQKLLARRECWAEMADDRHVVLVFGPGASEADADKLAAALDEIAAERTGLKAPDANGGQAPAATAAYETDAEERIGEPFAIPLMPPDEAETESVPIGEAAGRTAAETVIPYPPGIPLLLPGERISETRIAAIRRLAAAGARFQGSAEAGISRIRVMAQLQREKETDR